MIYFYFWRTNARYSLPSTRSSSIDLLIICLPLITSSWSINAPSLTSIDLQNISFRFSWLWKFLFLFQHLTKQLLAHF